MFNPMEELAKEKMSEKLLLSFNEQFAANQNHQQALFIQFLSAILVVIIGYGYIYANTDNFSQMFEITKTRQETNYAVIHLIGTYLMSQFILTLLGTVILNIGYAFRRDQKAIYNIHLKYMNDVCYKEIFGRQAFNPVGHNLFDYLPEFNRMFFLGIYTLQVFLAVSLFQRLPQFSNFDWLNIPKWINALIYLFPLAWSGWLYVNYFKKYYWVMTDTKKSWIDDYIYRI